MTLENVDLRPTAKRLFEDVIETEKYSELHYCGECCKGEMNGELSGSGTITGRTSGMDCLTDSDTGISTERSQRSLESTVQMQTDETYTDYSFMAHQSTSSATHSSSPNIRSSSREKSGFASAVGIPSAPVPVDDTWPPVTSDNSIRFEDVVTSDSDPGPGTTSMHASDNSSKGQELGSVGKTGRRATTPSDLSRTTIDRNVSLD